MSPQVWLRPSPALFSLQRLPGPGRRQEELEQKDPLPRWTTEAMFEPGLLPEARFPASVSGWVAVRSPN